MFLSFCYLSPDGSGHCRLVVLFVYSGAGFESVHVCSASFEVTYHKNRLFFCAGSLENMALSAMNLNLHFAVSRPQENRLFLTAWQYQRRG